MKTRSLLVERGHHLREARFDGAQVSAGHAGRSGIASARRSLCFNGRAALMFPAIHPEARQVFDSFGRVKTDRHVAAERVGHERNLRWRREKILLDEPIHLREFNAEAGMRMI